MTNHIWWKADKANVAGQVHALLDALKAFGERFPIAAIEEEGHLETHDDKPHWPDLFICAGQESAKLAAHIKEKSEGKTRIISILDPGTLHDSFDALIRPSFEPWPVAENHISTTGLLSRISPVLLEHVRNDYDDGAIPELHEALQTLPSPYTAVLIGGRHVAGNVSEADAQGLGNLLNRMAEQHGGSLLITTCPRTEHPTTDQLKKTLQAPYYLFDVRRDSISHNPYETMLALADRIIVTGDSVRMVSESCSSGKPVYIFQSALEFNPYQPLHDELYQKKIAAPYDGSMRDYWKAGDNNQLHHLSEASRVAGSLVGQLT